MTLVSARAGTLWAYVSEPPARDETLEHERRLVARSQAGDREALGELLSRYGPLLYRSVLLPRLGSEAAAQDALSEVYARVIARIGRFTWGRASASGPGCERWACTWRSTSCAPAAGWCSGATRTSPARLTGRTR